MPKECTLMPTFCPHCFKAITTPVSGLESLLKIPVHERGKGLPRGARWVFSKATLAKFLNVPRERGRKIVDVWLKHGVAEPLMDGHGVYRISIFGYIVRRLWLRAGFPYKLKGQLKLRKKMLSKNWSKKL